MEVTIKLTDIIEDGKNGVKIKLEFNPDLETEKAPPQSAIMAMKMLDYVNEQEN